MRACGVGDALGQQQHDAEDAIKALDAQTHLVAHMQLVGGLDGVAVNAHVPGAYGGRGLGARLELAGCHSHVSTRTEDEAKAPGGITTVSGASVIAEPS